MAWNFPRARSDMYLMFDNGWQKGQEMNSDLLLWDDVSSIYHLDIKRGMLFLAISTVILTRIYAHRSSGRCLATAQMALSSH